MKINYKYRKTSAIEKNLVRIEVAKRLIDLLPKLPHIEESLRHKSLLKSSLFSAKIEGNKLEIEQVENERASKSKNLEKQEIFNILRCLKWVHAQKSLKQISLNLILKLHKFVLNNISEKAGLLRKEPSAIFNQAGIAIYMSPPPSNLPSLIEELIKIAKSKKENVVITGAIVQFAFEKIHPFLDGNGRVGRLLSTYILSQRGYGFRGLVVLEEYLANHREEYYDLLEETNKDITDFVEFFLEGIAVSAEKGVEELKDIKQEKAEDFLLPRRQEILAIIKDHKMLTFDFVKRRFPKVPESSLHYDFRQLIKKGFIKKLGSTRGVLYALK